MNKSLLAVLLFSATMVGANTSLAAAAPLCGTAAKPQNVAALSAKFAAAAAAASKDCSANSSCPSLVIALERIVIQYGASPADVQAAIVQAVRALGGNQASSQKAFLRIQAVAQKACAPQTFSYRGAGAGAGAGSVIRDGGVSAFRDGAASIGGGSGGGGGGYAPS